MNRLIYRDIDTVIKQNYIDFEILHEKTVLITGATGLIGKNIIFTLLLANKRLGLSIKVLAMVRNMDKAKKIFGEQANIKFILGDIREKININDNVDYIIHAASQTSSREFINHPVDTIITSFIGTRNILEFARLNPVKSFIYLSTMEVYGSPASDEKISEEHSNNLDSMKIRSCYPESKRICENLCVAYAAEYSVATKIVRLTQTFGPGVDYFDRRVFAEFARCAIQGRDIILHTKGQTRRNYLYTADAVTAIFAVMLKGVSGEAYNAANEETYCSIFEMAQLVVEKCAKHKIQVKIVLEDESKYGFAPVLHMNLDTRKLKALGWKPHYNLEKMFKNLICYMEEIES